MSAYEYDEKGNPKKVKFKAVKTQVIRTTVEFETDRPSEALDYWKANCYGSYKEIEKEVLDSYHHEVWRAK